MQPFIDKLVKDNWLDTADSLRALSASQWTQLQLPLRLEELLKKKLNASPAPAPPVASSSASSALSSSPSSSSPPAPATTFPSSSASSEEQVSNSYRGKEAEADLSKKRDSDVFEEEDFAVVYAAVTDESIFPVPLTEAIEKLQLDVPREALAGVLRTLFTVIDGVLAQPSNPKKRRLRKANPSFHNQVGRFRAAVRVMEAAGFCEGKMRDPTSGDLDEFFVMDTAYVMRLTDAHHLLAQLATHAGVPVPPLPSTGFNPYSSSIVSASGTSLSQVAGKHGQMRKMENAQLKEKIKQREQLLQTGGGEQVPLAPAVYALEELRQREKADRRLLAQQSDFDGDPPSGDKPSLTAADIARIKEIMGDGPSFRSRMQQQLEQLEKRKVFKSCTVRVLLPDRAVLQLSFAPHQTLRFVREQVEQFLHPDLRSPTPGTKASTAEEPPFRRWFLGETPPLRKVELNKTLYQEGFVPNCTLHLKLPDACPRFPHPFLDPETLQRHNLQPPVLSLSPSSSSSSFPSSSSPSSSFPSSPPSSSSSSSFSAPTDASAGLRTGRYEPVQEGSEGSLSVQPGQRGDTQESCPGSGSGEERRLSSVSSGFSGGKAEESQGGEQSTLTKKTSFTRNLFRRK
ncbi:conserved hypothetical protein [Neospora caninum Liverpool]|nr:conserved hypothetical protein [Neospora caninum Liverpool]CBZ49866.1 conserved hypothetical protein [Neospora caninum Liverpool]|eukprot:XP_003879901.1 conserved hypothetical protein [Neospora caninum Liverpool]